ncbi:hypothetical protein GALL_549350 [mine drainage metagenome]|uniref:Uncharacterized protein n=1 Tax=mine drainage metagenome TaxID=410659 RepID=A0A1J5P7T7_9ZZZZ
MRHHLRHLGVQALAHLGAAVVHPHAAVGIDLHQRPRLVEEGGGEGDAELHRGEGDAAPDHRAGGVERGDRRAAADIVAALRQAVDEPRQDVVLHRHAVGRGVARGVAVEVGAAHVEWVESQGAGDVVEHGFDGDHALRAAETAERRVRLGVGAAAV